MSQKIIRKCPKMSENGLTTSYSRSNVLRNLGKITIFIPVCSRNVTTVHKETVCSENS